MSPIILDGGGTWNYPVDLFDYPTKRRETHVYNKQTLGLRVA